jgi:signal transduction histidine kinase
MVAGDAAPTPDSVSARAVATGAAVFLSDTGHSRRPHRLLSAPLAVRGETVGVLTVERDGELPARERRALVALALHIGAALENARLAARQRRFADELADKVRAATDRLQALDRAKSAFVAMASHELRTPLTALVGYSELLATRVFSADEVRRQAEIMRRQTRRLAGIIDDFLDLSRLERGESPPLRLGEVALGPALASAAELLAGAHGVSRVVVDCEPGLALVRADPQALERILVNLLSNALKYSPAHTPVAVRARATTGGVVISVEDAGRGIAPDALPRVFEPYFRAPDAVGRAPGSGLGLAMVKSLVEAHEGRIHVESTVGIGTRVTLELPAVP